MHVITGTTKVYGVIADPIAQVQSPEVVNPIFDKEGFDAVCVPIHVKKADVASFLGTARLWRNFAGIFVSVPHKEITASLCSSLDKASRLVGAVNVIRPHANGGWQGAMYDGIGFVDALSAHGCALRQANVVVIGAGGVAIAIVHALLQRGVQTVTVCNRTKARAERLCERIYQGMGQNVQDRLLCRQLDVALGQGKDGQGKDGQDKNGQDKNGQDVDLVINATCLGMAANDPLPLRRDQIKSSMFVAEVVAKPRTTKLLTVARELGCQVMPGHAMFQYQMEHLRAFLGISV